MAKVKNHVRVLAGKKSWETKLKKMTQDPKYKFRIEMGQKIGLDLAKYKRDYPEGYEAFRQQKLEHKQWLEEQARLQNDEQYHDTSSQDKESTVLIDYLNGTLSFRTEFQGMLEDVYSDVLWNEYDGNEDEMLKTIRDRCDNNPALIGESIEVVETESKDYEKLRNAMYAIIQTVAGTVPPLLAQDIEILASEIIPPWFRKGHRNK